MGNAPMFVMSAALLVVKWPRLFGGLLGMENLGRCEVCDIVI